MCLSGNSGQEDVDRCLAAGYDAVLVKPILLNDFGELLLTFTRRGMIPLRNSESTALAQPSGT
mgnify:FL=1